MVVLFYIACWAPELAPPSPSPSPTEAQLREVDDLPPLRVVQVSEIKSTGTQDGPAPPDTPKQTDSQGEDNIENPLPDTANQRIDDFEPEVIEAPNSALEPNEAIVNDNRIPPYTTWTTTEDVKIRGPNGGVILTLMNNGTRIEVLEFQDGMAHIVCSGCSPPNQNQAGWINETHATHPDEIPTDHPLARILPYRKQWASQKEIPQGLSHTDLCMLVDNGYQFEDDFAVWQYQGGSITLSLTDTDTAPQVVSPYPHEEMSWRCAMERGQIGD